MHFPHLSLYNQEKCAIFAVENGEYGLYLGIEQAFSHLKVGVWRCNLHSVCTVLATKCSSQYG